MRNYKVFFEVACTDEGEIPDITPEDMIYLGLKDGIDLGSYNIKHVKIEQIKR